MEDEMVRLSDLFELTLLDQMIEEGHVTLRRHNTLPLGILNYSPSAQYNWKWNEVTLQCRGLIYNVETLEVVARPFEKFFSWDQGIGKETWDNPMPPAGPCIRMEKMDGSLGIMYNDGWDHSIATRGSFHSEQAEWATEFLHSTNEFWSTICLLWIDIPFRNRLP